MRFVAIDFETADYEPDSACAIGLVRVEDGEIVARYHHLIRPPRRAFVFTDLHGISWKDVRGQPTFSRLWPELTEFWRGADFFAAHNAAFDRSVLQACCTRAGLRPPAKDFTCTVELSRRVWGIRPTKLSDVCRALRIPLNHHQALSDAEACARIVIAANAIAEKSRSRISPTVRRTFLP
ncbi:MAG: 3'-5' exonuclease [Gemmatimonadota bacterium]